MVSPSIWASPAEDFQIFFNFTEEILVKVAFVYVVVIVT